MTALVTWQCRLGGAIRRHPVGARAVEADGPDAGALRWYGLALVVVPMATTATAVALLGAPEGTGWVLASALAAGLLFALQHVSLAHDNGWLGGMVVLVFITATAVPSRFLQGWIASRTGSPAAVGRGLRRPDVVERTPAVPAPRR
jgi:hypothetical protein